MQVLDFKYSYPPVDLNKDDVEWLWREISLLFDPYSKEDRFELKRKISVTTGKGRNHREIQETDLESLLRTGFVHSRVTRLNLTFLTVFIDSSGVVQSPNVSLSFNNGTDVRISGSKEWVQRVRGLLDDFLVQRKGKNTSPRAVTFLILLLSLPVAFSYIGVQRFSWDLLQALTALGIGAFFISLPMWAIAKQLYPVPLIAIDTPVEWPWYVKWAHQVLIVVVLTVVATILVSVLVR